MILHCKLNGSFDKILNVLEVHVRMILFTNIVTALSYFLKDFGTNEDDDETNATSNSVCSMLIM